ncbi:MAG: hypothetical protein ACLP8X_32310 [Streptosporangiaceae bacterium]
MTYPRSTSAPRAHARRNSAESRASPCPAIDSLSTGASCTMRGCSRMAWFSVLAAASATASRCSASASASSRAAIARTTVEPRIAAHSEPHSIMARIRYSPR